MEGKIFCADDFLLSGHSRSHKACTECGSPVTNKLVQVTTRHSQSVSVLTLLQAVTGYYHSHCFKCKLCQKPLASEEYSVDQDNQVPALSHSVTLPSLSLSGLLFGGLLLSLWPQVWQMQEDDLPGGEHGDPHQSQGKLSSGWCQLRETTQLQALDRDFHVECFVCESCGCRLSDDSDSRQDLLAISA